MDTACPQTDAWTAQACAAIGRLRPLSGGRLVDSDDSEEVLVLRQPSLHGAELRVGGEARPMATRMAAQSACAEGPRSRGSVVVRESLVVGLTSPSGSAPTASDTGHGIGRQPLRQRHAILNGGRPGPASSTTGARGRRARILRIDGSQRLLVGPIAAKRSPTFASTSTFRREGQIRGESMGASSRYMTICPWARLADVPQRFGDPAQA